jgi:hypothetical protein
VGVVTAEMNLGTYQDTTGRFRWRLWNGLRLMAVSGQSFDDRLDAELAALRFRTDGGGVAYDVLPVDASWYWQARDGAGRPVAIASRRFDSSFNATHEAAYIQAHVCHATFS